MSRIRSLDTYPEMLVRRTVHGLGFRYRLHKKGLPGRPDLVFSSRRKAIFVHGCFWHQHGECREGRVPSSNQAYWLEKLGRNVDRDKRNIRSLEELGWKVLVLWGCELADQQSLKKRLSAFLNGF